MPRIRSSSVSVVILLLISCTSFTASALRYRIHRLPANLSDATRSPQAISSASHPINPNSTNTNTLFNSAMSPPSSYSPLTTIQENSLHSNGIQNPPSRIPTTTTPTVLNCSNLPNQEISSNKSLKTVSFLNNKSIFLNDFVIKNNFIDNW